MSQYPLLFVDSIYSSFHGINGINNDEIVGLKFDLLRFN